MSGAGEGGRNEVPTKNGKKSHFVGRLFGYTDSYYEKKEQAQQEMEEAERLAKLDMQRWLARMQRDEAEKEAAVAEAKTNRKQSKLQQKLNVIKEQRENAEDLHKENLRILEDTIDAYTHMPEINKYVKPNPAHHAMRTEDELYHDPSIVDHKKYPNPSKALVKQSEYRDDNIPNPWWERPGIRTRRYEEEMTWEQVMQLNEYETYTPGHYSMFYGKDKIYAFPPKKRTEKESKRDVEDKKNESRYQWNGETQDYTRKGFRENAGETLSNTFKDNNRLDDAFTPPTEDGLRRAIYQWRSDEQVFPETTLLPTAEQIKAMEAKMSRAKARSHLPAFDFKRNRLDMSRMRVRRFLVEEGGSVNDALDANSSVAGSLADGSVITSVVDVKLPRYNEDKKGKGGGEGEDGEGSTVISDLESVEPGLRFDGKPHIIHDMTKPMMTMKELTTMGLGGKAGPTHEEGAGAHIHAAGIREHNAGFQDNLDKAFDTNRAQLVSDANKEGVVLDGIEVYRKVGDHYVLENRSAMSRRSDFEEDSLSLGRQKVKIKLKRHRGALGLDKFKMSRRNKLSLESKATKRERATDRRTKKQMDAKIAGVAKMVEEIKHEQDRLTYERQREAHRQGGA